MRKHAVAFFFPVFLAAMRGPGSLDVLGQSGNLLGPHVLVGLRAPYLAIGGSNLRFLRLPQPTTPTTPQKMELPPPQLRVGRS